MLLMPNRTQLLRRAPALIVRGRSSSEGDTRYRFRLPVPPVPTAGSYAAHAVERRAKKLYFAVLDAMRTGVIEPTLRGKLTRLIIEARPRPDYMLRHLVRILDAVARRTRETGGKPLLPLPADRLEDVDVSIASSPASTVHEALRWPLEWLHTRGLALAKTVKVIESGTSQQSVQM